jgi:hypothetical protein
VRFVTAFLALALTSQPLFAADLAPRPPMGWNSWDSYGLRIDEQQFRDNVAVLARDLKPFGWTYAVIDEGWFMENPEDRPTPEKLRYAFDANGRYVPVTARFPTGFVALGKFVHDQGLAFGIHIVRGIPRLAVEANPRIAGSHFRLADAADTADSCPWDPTNWGVKDNAAGQAWYDSLIAQYAEWGVDLLKVDCISDHPHKTAEIAMIHRAIETSGRPIVLSLSPGPTAPDLAASLPQVAQMWRISDDVWDVWSNPKDWPRSVKGQFDLAAAWAPFAHAGSWPDADMLPLGHLGPFPDVDSERETRLSRDEQRSMVTLWAMARSPLILGANLTRLDDWTRSLITNRDVIAIDQASRHGRRAAQEAQLVAWTAEAPDHSFYLALFNIGEETASVSHGFDFYDLPPASYRLRELWSGTDLPEAREIRTSVPPHGVMLYRLIR